MKNFNLSTLPESTIDSIEGAVAEIGYTKTIALLKDAGTGELAQFTFALYITDYSHFPSYDMGVKTGSGY